MSGEGTESIVTSAYGRSHCSTTLVCIRSTTLSLTLENAGMTAACPALRGTDVGKNVRVVRAVTEQRGLRSSGGISIRYLHDPAEYGRRDDEGVVS